MSSVALQIVARYRQLCLQSTKYVVTSQHLIARLKSDKSGKSDLTSSTILLQDGIHMQELPVIVRKLKNVFAPFDGKIECTSGFSTRYTSGENDIHELIHKEFRRCSTLEDVVNLVSKCSTLTPNIALGAVERVYEIKDKIRNDPNSLDPSCHVDTIPNTESLGKLIDVIKQTEDVYALLRALRVLSLRDDQYLTKLCDELLERITDNKLSISQLCDVVSFFHSHRHMDKFSDSIEKCWVGFIGRENEFEEASIVKCFNILHCLKTSQKIILGTLEKKMEGMWWQMNSVSMLAVLNALDRNKLNSIKILQVAGRWLNTNIQSISEESLLQLIAKFTLINYTDSQIQSALERYVKVKGLQIKSHVLIVTIMNHCTFFKIRNANLLNGCAEYFISKGRELEPVFIKPMLYPLGYLNFKPNNSSKFWLAVEDVLSTNLPNIGVEDTIDIMLACIYLEKHPINFMPLVFNPYFLDRINSQSNAQLLRNKLKLLDTAMTLESKIYSGPILPKDHSCKSIYLDGRIKRLVNNLRDTFETIVGSYECLSTFVVLPGVFTTELYIVDVMFHPKNFRISIMNSFKRDQNVNIAILINLPEHFCSSGDTLLGPQAMRIKHLRLLGFKVVNLNYEALSRLKMHRPELEKYIKEKLKTAADAL